MFGQVLPLTSTTQSFYAGEHVIVAWCDRNYSWELGVVEKCQSANIVVSHMVPTNQEKTCWVFPEEAVTLPVENDQVLLRRVTVHYHQSMRIRVSLTKETVTEASLKLQEFNKQLLLL